MYNRFTSNAATRTNFSDRMTELALVYDVQIRVIFCRVFFLQLVGKVVGSKREIELCTNGKDIVVDNKNKEYYVYLVIQYRYVTSIVEQVAYLSKGVFQM
ncbi:hypothetical protein H5410_004910 [Solanum commersonii]|uniref:HECT-type E3 ubiquitin transferase n=1 Tax=Solanum commersonii TaxID=4109 RepID=A0A9J6A658_SOLCO|nr:hypothetical protein H5410_004910 [Solanum commersonii]